MLTQLVMPLVLSSTVFGCSIGYPSGVVKNSEQAIAIADHECGDYSVKYYPGRWHTELTGENWLVWKKGGMQISIDAKTGRTEGCIVVTSQDSH